MSDFVWRHRGALVNTIRALQNGKLTVGFLGGSITDGREHNRWSEVVPTYLAEAYPDALIVVENAAIGATGTECGLFRAQRDIIERGCDLVFVEYAVNDTGERERDALAREGLLRTLLRDGRRDVIVTYTYQQLMYERMARGDTPDTIADFELLCDHYGIGSVWMARYAFDEMLKGRMRYHEWLPDGLHPTQRGSLSYAQSVIEYLKVELARADARQTEMPAPLDPRCWEHIESVPLESVRRAGPWLIRRGLENIWTGRMLFSPAPGSRLSFEFEGRRVLAMFDYGRDAASVRVRLDGGVWRDLPENRPDWMGISGWPLLRELVGDVPSGKHTLDMETFFACHPNSTGADCGVMLIGLVK